MKKMVCLWYHLWHHYLLKTHTFGNFHLANYSFRLKEDLKIIINPWFPNLLYKSDYFSLIVTFWFMCCRGSFLPFAIIRDRLKSYLINYRFYKVTRMLFDLKKISKDILPVITNYDESLSCYKCNSIWNELKLSIHTLQ